MSLSPVSREDAARRLVQRAGGAVDSFEVLGDLIRAEVHARKHAPRAATLSRVARLIAPAAAVNEERLEEVCDALEREGDLVLAPGGVLYATPTRVVAVKKAARVFGSLPTRALSMTLGREVVAIGAVRTVATTDDLAELVARLSGALVTPEAWAGLDRAPKADAAFLSGLDQRLEWEALGAGSLEKDGALEWRSWDAAGQPARWRRGDAGRLWWARARFGGHHRAWTAGAPPSTSAFVELSADDADRARFALSREAGGGSPVVIRRAGGSAVVEVPTWLPRPEFRWLSLHARPSSESKGMRWEVAADDEASLTKLLAERLGLVVEVR